jgi:hypothetical protein
MSQIKIVSQFKTSRFCFSSNLIGYLVCSTKFGLTELELRKVDEALLDKLPYGEEIHSAIVFIQSWAISDIGSFNVVLMPYGSDVLRQIL